MQPRSWNIVNFLTNILPQKFVQEKQKINFLKINKNNLLQDCTPLIDKNSRFVARLHSPIARNYSPIARLHSPIARLHSPEQS